MSNYTRFVSYLYEYKNGTKSENRGFIKVESRDNVVKMEVHIKSASQQANIPLNIYGFVHEQGQLPGIFLGSCYTGRGTTSCKLRFATQNIQNTKYNFQDLSGLLIFCENNICYGTSWNDHPIKLDQFYALPPAAADENKTVQTPPNEEMPDTNNLDQESNTDNLDQGSNADNLDQRPNADNLDQGPNADNLNQETPVQELPGAEAPLEDSNQQSLTQESPSENIPADNLAIPTDIQPAEVPVVNMQPESPADESAFSPEYEIPLTKEYSAQQADEGSPDDNAASFPEYAFPTAEQHPHQRAVQPAMGMFPSQNNNYPSTQQLKAASTDIFELPVYNAPPSAMQPSQELYVDSATALSDDRWQQLQQEYPAIDPFPDDEIIDCIRLEQKDLPNLRRNNWLIGNNQFILHAFSNHQHLIMGRMNDSDQPVYILGVPGVYDPKEKFMANMFGFPYFKPGSEHSLHPGNFGYWYRAID